MVSDDTGHCKPHPACTRDGKEDFVRETLTISEAAAALGISRTTAYQSARDGRLPVIRVSPRRLVVPKDALARLLAGPPKEAA